MDYHTTLLEERKEYTTRISPWRNTSDSKKKKLEDMVKRLIDFRISLEESDDEDYMVIFDEKSFSYKIIYVNDLKTDSENDNIPSSPNPTDDLDYFKDFENEFPAIVYNDGLTSKSDLEINPLVSFESIDKFNLIGEASLSEYDEEIVSRFNDLFNIIHPDDSKSEKANDDNDIGIIQSSEDNEISHGKNGLSKTSHDKTIRTFKTDIAPLPAANQRHPWLIYQIQEYTEGIRHSYEQRLETIWSRSVNRVHVLDFEGLTPEMRQDLAVRLRMVYSGEGQQVFVSHAWRRLFEIRAPLFGGVRRRMTWRQFILALGLHKEQEMAEAGDFLGPAPSYVLIRDPVRRLCHMMIAYSISGRGQAPKKVTGIDLFYLRSMDRGTTNIPHLLAQYFFRHAEGRKSGARMSGGHFIRHVAMHFGLVSDEGLRGLQGPERQQAAAAGAYEADKASPTVEEGAQEIPVPAPTPAPAQVPPPPPLAPQPWTMS
ncbi:hypothetical protein Tco_1509844 [Tanacetum coccineum]